MSLPPRLPETDRDEVFMPCDNHPENAALMLFHGAALCETCYQHVLSDVVLELREQQRARGEAAHEH